MQNVDESVGRNQNWDIVLIYITTTVVFPVFFSLLKALKSYKCSKMDPKRVPIFEKGVGTDLNITQE